MRRSAREHSRFKTAVISAFSLVLILGLGVMFYEGFRFLYSLGGIGLMVVHRLFALFFMGLGAMLILSGAITAFTTIYRSEEVPHLLLRPLGTGDIIMYKYIETTVLSSWAFFFIIIPFVGAYAIHEHLSPLFSIWTIVFSIPFVMFCSGVGTLLCIVFVRIIPMSRVFWGTLGLVAWLAFCWLWVNASAQEMGGESPNVVLARIIPGLRLASSPLLPSAWVADGIMALTRGQWMRGFMFWGILVLNVLLLGMIIELVGRALFFGGWQRSLRTGKSVGKKSVLLWPLEKLLSLAPSDLSAMIMKDVKNFLRDATQWSQSVIFFGLLGIYFLNLRNFEYHTLTSVWRNLITFLNIFSVSAVMCSFGSRFIYPQLSLEGQGFWILGMSPTTVGRILMAKFLTAMVSLLTVSVLLMVISTRMLHVSKSLAFTSVLLAGAMSLVVASLGTGLGAVYLDLKQRNPAAIVSSFGGTLNLVLSLIFMFAVIIPLGLLFHLRFAGYLGDTGFQRGIVLAYLWVFATTVFSAVTPLWAGYRQLQEREY